MWKWFPDYNYDWLYPYEYILWTINSQPTICYDYDKRLEIMRLAKMDEMAKNINPNMDKEVAEGLSWMGGTFITEYDTPKQAEPSQTDQSQTEPSINKPMNINEFLNDKTQ